MAPDGSTTMSSRLSCWVNSDHSWLRMGRLRRVQGSHVGLIRTAQAFTTTTATTATTTTTTTAADADQTGSDVISLCVISASSIDDGKELRRQEPFVISGLTDGRTDGRRRTKRQRDRKRDEERESEIQSFCLFLSLSFSLAFSPSLFCSVFSVLFLFFFFFSTFHINFSQNDDIYIFHVYKDPA